MTCRIVWTSEKIEPTRDDGEPTGEELFAYQPKSFVVVGRLDLRRSSIVTCQGSRGWDDYRLLHHFDSRQPLDRLPRTD